MVNKAAFRSRPEEGKNAIQIKLGRKNNQTEGTASVKSYNWNEFDKLEELQPRPQFTEQRENERGCRN